MYDNWKINTHKVKNDNGKANSFFFSNLRTQDIFVGLDLYGDRFYPYGCKKNDTLIELSVFSGTK